MTDGFVKVCTTSPSLRVADCEYNTRQIIDAIVNAAKSDCKLVVFPELSITGYTCGDLFLQQSLQRAAEASLEMIIKSTQNLDVVAVVGVPAHIDSKLYNCAAVICHGNLLGLVPKTHIPNYGELCEKRYFVPAPSITERIIFAGTQTSFGAKLLFRCDEMPQFCFAAEICEDLWATIPPSTGHAMAGATIIANLSASDETVGKAEYRRQLVIQQSARLICAYLYSDAGYGESSTDMVFSGHNLISENGALLSESKPFQGGYSCTEVDLDRIVSDRCRNTSFEVESSGYETVYFNLNVHELELLRTIPQLPFVPEDNSSRAERCELVLSIQTAGLIKRLEHTRAKTAVVGISGGLDSCLALLVAVRAMNKLGRASSDVIAVTMPCFGTTNRTRTNAEILCNELGVVFKEIPITETVRSHFRDIGQDENDFNTTFENAQARIRTLELMDLANSNDGLVVGTGDLSELALGWATYNGDHMSMYGVNAGVPKTLIRHIVRFVADTCENPALKAVLLDILDTPVSPELLPASDNGEILQQTESIVGPYELHDFYLYYVLRFGFTPKKIYRIAKTAFCGRYTDDELLYWLNNFYRRFFAQQFKRSCLPDGPKVGSVTLSPRGDWRMPSDACAVVWQRELEGIRTNIHNQDQL